MQNMVEINGAYGTSRGIDNLVIGIAGVILFLLMGEYIYCQIFLLQSTKFILFAFIKGFVFFKLYKSQTDKNRKKEEKEKAKLERKSKEKNSPKKK